MLKAFVRDQPLSWSLMRVILVGNQFYDHFFKASTVNMHDEKCRSAILDSFFYKYVCCQFFLR